MSFDLFPKTTVTGEAFCNRTQERKMLIHYISIGRHVWIQAHRRHGKTSLVAQSIEDMKKDSQLSYARCHLRFASDINSCIKKIFQSIDVIIADILIAKHRKSDLGIMLTKFTEILSNAFKRLKPSIEFKGGIPVITTSQSYDLDALEDALSGLDKLAQKLKYRAVLLIDEFQEIGKISEHMELESTIRQCVEDAKATTFLFAGSERTLMAQSLGDKKRPLYKHTQPFELSRIEEKCYLTHLNKLSNNTWGKELPESSFKAIMLYSQRHPYYVNWLCDEIWIKPIIPSVDDVLVAWDKVVYLSSREDAHEIGSLTINEKKVIIAIAQGFNTAMTSSKSLTRINMASSSVKRTIEALLKKELIDKNQKTYYIINPAIAAQALKDG